LARITERENAMGTILRGVMRLGRGVVAGIAVASFLFTNPTTRGAVILSLDATRTGDENEGGGARYLTAPSMADATGVLTGRGFTVQTRPNFLAANTVGAAVLYTGAVSGAFTAQELTDIQAFVNAGGGLVMQRDWGSFYPAADPLAAAFGVTYDTGPYGPGGVPSPVNQTVAHPIWSGPAGSVNSFNEGLSSAIASGATSIGVHSTNTSKSALAYKQVGLGRVIFLTDMDAWDTDGDGMTPLAGNAQGIVWANIFEYAVPEPTTLCGVCIFAAGALLRRRRADSRHH
jgi:hypothetical protein